MSLNIKALATVAGILCGSAFLIMGIANLIFPSYGVAFLQLGDSIYPGYTAGGGFGSVIVATLYAMVDGAVAGGIFAWLYNMFAGRQSASA